MSYITIRKSDEDKAMALLCQIADGAYTNDDEIREDLHSLIRAATGHDEVLVRG